MTQRLQKILGWTLTAAATYAAVFVVPYRFPLREPVLSDTWTAGSTNQIAAIGVAVVSVLVTVLCWYRTPPALQDAPEDLLSLRYLSAGIATAILWTATLGILVARPHVLGRRGLLSQPASQRPGLPSPDLYPV